MTLFQDWDFHDASVSPAKYAKLEPGRYEIERIPNPMSWEGPWLVLKGTQIGGLEAFILAQSDENNEELRILIEEEPRLDGSDALVAMNQEFETQAPPWEVQ